MYSVWWFDESFDQKMANIVDRYLDFSKEFYTTLKSVISFFKICFQNYGQLKRKFLRPKNTSITFVKFELSRLGGLMRKNPVQKRLWTQYSRLDIKHLLRWDLSCSWTSFKVLTSISWCPVFCRDMFDKDLSTAIESNATLSTVREMMYFTKRKRSYFRLPLPLPPKVADRTASKYSPHRAQMAGLVPVVARGIVTGLTK